MTKPVIVVGCPVQDREEVIGEYLDCIYNLDYPKDRLIPSFFVNNSSDRTSEIILDWILKHNKEYLNIIFKENKRVYKGRKDKQDRIHRDYTLFSVVRNQFLKLVSREKWDFLLSIDSDILVKPDILNKLLGDKKDIVSALVYNGHEYGKDWFNYRVHTVKNGREGYFVYEYMPKYIFEVDVTGACYLIARKVIDSKVKYKPTRFGEDIGFCEEAKKKGFRIYCNPTIGTYHKLVGDNR